MELKGRTVYIARDHFLDEVMNEVQRQLEAGGARVIRGPESAPGQKVSLAPGVAAPYLGEAEVAMFSSRNLAPRELIAGAPRLLGIVNPTIGLETVDVDAASELGVIVGHGATPENFNSMAEATMMFILMLLYKPDLTREVTRGQRQRPRPVREAAWARMLMNRTVGIIGFGRIGRAVARRLQGWDVRILANDPFIDPASVPPYATLVDLDTLLRESDVVTIHIAVTPQSRGLMNAAAFARMKPTAYFVNTARGDAVDEPALVAALRERRIAGAALDNTLIEPPPADHPLQGMDRVILTPHMVGHTSEVYGSFAPAAVENVMRVLAGELPLHCKNPEIADRFRARYRRLRGG